MYARYFDIPGRRVPQADRRAARVRPARPNAPMDQVEPLSGGMKRRLTIARALINEPDLILLDEPTTGLDPQARHLLWERLYRLKRRGATLLLTTHYMDEAEQLCDRLVVMDKAKIVAEGSPRAADRRATRRARCSSCAWRDARRGSAGRQARRPRRSGRGAARIGCCSTRPMASGRSSSVHASAASRSSSALVRRSSARGRLPAAHRPIADRVSR